MEADRILTNICVACRVVALEIRSAIVCDIGLDLGGRQ